jgi:hypothetical protein
MLLPWQLPVRLCSSGRCRMPRAWNGTSPIKEDAKTRGTNDRGNGAKIYKVAEHHARAGGPHCRVRRTADAGGGLRRSVGWLVGVVRAGLAAGLVRLVLVRAGRAEQRRLSDACRVRPGHRHARGQARGARRRLRERGAGAARERGDAVLAGGAGRARDVAS